jgi:hypothetical protein
MFKTMNLDEMMTVNGGFYYVAKYVGYTPVGTVQVASGSGIKCYVWNGNKFVARYKLPWE